eukprot:TRINITY_DN10042_c0_g1_i4.p1 TRINITY_DN10042_c0_g1~~TRINITY_DN10042_c0_g1_i4.p1  ORF type:complete len:119 (+),score=4.14 TRINITY_DN10042_c0_g1_i4:323-679(+)
MQAFVIYPRSAIEEIERKAVLTSPNVARASGISAGAMSFGQDELAGAGDAQGVKLTVQIDLSGGAIGNQAAGIDGGKLIGVCGHGGYICVHVRGLYGLVVFISHVDPPCDGRCVSLEF